MGIILSAISILLMITIHEFGHFLAGRLFKVNINEFSIGMGPAIFKKKGKRETTYSLRMIPLGGYCSFDDDDKLGGGDKNLNNIHPFKRIVILFSGAFLNLLTAIIVLFLMFKISGIPTPTTEISQVQNNSPAYNIIFEGDEIIKINNMEIKNAEHLINTLNTEGEKGQLSIQLKRNDEIKEIIVSPIYNDSLQKYVIGINTKSIYVPLSFLESIKTTFISFKTTVFGIFTSIGGLVSGQYKLSDMSGIIGIVDIMSSVAKPSTIYYFWQIFALISINLGVMNLLPFPALDGSKILITFIELITKKKIPEKIENIINVAGLLFLIALFVIVTFSDIIKLF